MEPNEQDQLDELLNDVAVQMGYQPGGAGPNGEHPLSMAGSLHAYFANAQHRGFISEGTYDALRTHYGEEKWTYAYNS